MPNSVVLNAVLSFLKKYWKETLLVILLFGTVAKSHLDYKRLEKAYETSQDSLKNQIVTLKELHADELSRRDDALKEYQDKIVQLEEQYEKQLQDLQEETGEQHDEIVEEIIERKQFSENKEELAEKLQDAFGFAYVP